MAISADPPEDSAALIKDKGISIPLLSDPGLKTISAYGVAMEGRDIAVPSVFIITKSKKIHWKYIGEDMADRPDEQKLLDVAKAAKLK